VAKYVFVEVPLEHTMMLPDNFVFDSVGHINFYSPKTIRQLLQSCHLQVLKQFTTNPPKAAYTYRKGKKGLLSYYIKQSLLQLFPNLAIHLFTYHESLICETQEEKNLP
jgi:hypothetical protein